MDIRDDLITIGKITRTQGNKGEVRVMPITDFPTRFEFLDRVYLEKDGQVQEKEIEDLRYQKQFVIIKFTDTSSIDDALSLKDNFIKIPEDELLPLEDGQYYIFQLVDYSVLTEEGELLGKVRDVITTGGTDIILVDNGEKEYMIPAAREIVIEINEEEKKIIIAPLPGLLDL